MHISIVLYPQIYKYNLIQTHLKDKNKIITNSKTPSPKTK